MSATIRIESGISAGTSFWIDRAVLRVGSDPSCDLCLPSSGIDPHALTLEYRAGEYHVYNRTEDEVVLGASSLSAGQRASWRVDECLVLGGEVKLLLEIDGDPAPSPSPSASDDVHPSNDALDAEPERSAPASEKTSPDKSSSMVQLGVIGVCLLCCVMFVSVGGGAESASVAIPKFEEIVAASLEDDVADQSRRVVRRLQLAQAALVRGRRDVARQRFAELRDQLLLARPDQATDRPLESQSLAYVEYRLGQLQ